MNIHAAKQLEIIVRAALAHLPVIKMKLITGSGG
jgi:hypothetical protein